ncbi:hypothetical protein [Herpetosiphon geysericola]|uniref:Yip1 domain-containing protein n=1 Tax=Herpetosiphon geysericola TaxID=70996 RepID=A0A0P6YG55_9CHLR|nr:hypothetical protein [Herpetosiphon geysericola]KPL81219.1 hypothetical protein SE18_21265 [Herpetosiphon geysericola]
MSFRNPQPSSSQSAPSSPPSPPIPTMQLPELLQASIALAGKPSEPPFGLVRGRGSLKNALIYVAIGAFVSGLLLLVMGLLIYHYPGKLASQSLVVSVVGHTAGFAALISFIAQRQRLSFRQRDEFATALAMAWPPIMLVVGGLFYLLTGFVSFVGAISGLALSLLFMVATLKALRVLFSKPYEETFVSVAYGLLLYNLILSFLGYLVGQIV